MYYSIGQITYFSFTYERFIRRNNMIDTRLKESIGSFAAANRENIIRDIGKVVAVNSVSTGGEDGMPFGKKCAEVLDTALKIASDMGLETKNCEGYLGYASYGSGEDYIATITHLDVVPAGDGWLADPFTMREKEGWLIGRGVMDDKGPSVLCLYMLKYLKDNGIQLRHQIRALLGLSEEVGMEDAAYYLSHYSAPVFCFTPDGSFPVCNGEKGIFHGRITSRAAAGNICDIRGGTAANAIPGRAEATVRCEHELLPSDNVEVHREGDKWHLISHGIGGHASRPAGTVNAIGELIDYILANNIADKNEKAFLETLQKIHSAPDGSLIGVAADDGKFDPLTIVCGVIGYDDNGHLFQTIDSRYPTNTSGEKIRSIISDAAGETADVVTLTDAEPFYISADKPEIKVCIDTYNEYTGENARPFTMGGGTYARHFPNAVSFGVETELIKEPEWAGSIHGPEEAANADWLLKALEMYIAAIIELDSSL